MKNRNKPKSNELEKTAGNRNKQKEIALEHSFKKMKWIVATLSVILLICIASIIYFILPKNQNTLPQTDKINHQDTINNTNAVIEKQAVSDITAKNVQEKPNYPDIKFDKTEHNYDTIKKDSDGKCEFVFKNIGTLPLSLSNVTSSCGCTVPTWPKEPILPGNSGVIKVVYDTKRVGPINKSVTVTSNAKSNPVILSIKGDVIE